MSLQKRLAFENNTLTQHNPLKPILFYSKYFIIRSSCCFPVDLMAYSPSIKILDNLNLVSSKSIYFWCRLMHFQLISSAPSTELGCYLAENYLSSALTMAGQQKPTMCCFPRSTKIDLEGCNGHKARAGQRSLWNWDSGSILPPGSVSQTRSFNYTRPPESQLPGV